GSNAVIATTPVTVTSNTQWRLTGKKTWCIPSAVEGKSGDHVSFTVGENTSGAVRNITYTFMSGSKTANLVVIQNQNNVFEMITGKEYKVASSSSDISVRVNTNIKLSVEIPDDSKWISNAYPIKESDGVKPNWLTFKVAANNTYKARTGRIVLKGDGLEDQVIVVNQPQNDAILLGQATYSVTPEGGVVTVDVQTNVNYSVTIPTAKQGWVTKTSGTNTLTQEGLNSFQETFNVGAVSANSRVASITFSGGTSEGGMASSVAKFIQLSANPVYTTVPDSSFRAYLETSEYAIVLDKTSGQCAIAEAGLTTTSFSIGSRKIYSVKGIEAFKTLKTLSCTSNFITELDLSQNTALTSLSCTYNKLNKIVLGDVNITSLSFSSTALRNPNQEYSTDLVISSNKLKTFSCSSTYLVTLDMSECSALTSLTVSNATALKTLYLKESQVPNLTTFNKGASTTVVYK
ncbi:MAG TPA: BACON domain-containing carbohydrate-binding protein, partial [Bacteroidales bacterium]|nr:BACON domain-containing carbohydrate-binding protein [Bacteroidales bacterium]